MRLLAVEFLLISSLAAIGAYALWEFIPWKELLGSAFAVCIGIYWLLQLLGRSRMAFRVAAILTVLPHAAGIWAHNSLEWYRFLGVEASFGASRPQLWTAAMFMLCLAGLVALYRVIGLRVMGRELSSRGVDAADRRAVILNEGIALAVLVGAGLTLALITAQAGSILGGIESMPDMLSSAVLPIGGGAAIVFAYCVTLWFRSRGETGGGEASSTEDGNVVEPEA